MVDFLARSMLRHPMFQVLNAFDGVPMELESSKFNSTLELVSTKSTVRLNFYLLWFGLYLCFREVSMNAL